MLSRKQSELIRVLRKQLEAKERELADTKWVFERFKESPSWKLTAPLRWIVRQLRPAKTSLTGVDTTPSRSRYSVTPAIEAVTSAESADQFADQIKQAHSSLFRLSLESFFDIRPVSPSAEHRRTGCIHHRCLVQSSRIDVGLPAFDPRNLSRKYRGHPGRQRIVR